MRVWRAFRSWILVLWFASSAVAADWRVGVARSDITPTKLLWMAGYAARDHAAEGTLHPLWAKALAIEDAGRSRAVIVTLDLIGLNRDVCDAVARRAKELVGVPRERILFNSSHTHCGPVVSTLTDLIYPVNAQQRADLAEYTAALEDKLVRVIQEACGNLRPANLAYGEGKATFGANRRTLREKPQVDANKPVGPVDHTVPVLAVRDGEGRLIAALFGYACHNTTLGIYQYNGDYAGFAQIALEKAHPGMTALFMIGCGADVNPNPRREVALAEQHGNSLAAAVDEVLKQKLHPVRGRLAVAFSRIDLPFVDPPSKEELQQRAQGKNVYHQRLARRLLDELAQGRRLETSYPCPLQVVCLGRDFTLVGMSGEVVVDYMLRLRQEFPGERLWVASYCNEVFAYVPSERVLAEGGYEGGDAMVYFGWYGPFQRGLEDRLVGEIKKLVTQCRQEP